jgi:hypothetical protein
VTKLYRWEHDEDATQRAASERRWHWATVTGFAHHLGNNRRVMDFCSMASLAVALERANFRACTHKSRLFGINRWLMSALPPNAAV